MADESKPAPKREGKVEDLQLNRETVRELTEGDAQAVRGGIMDPTVDVLGIKTAQKKC